MNTDKILEIIQEIRFNNSNSIALNNSNLDQDNKKQFIGENLEIVNDLLNDLLDLVY